MIGYLLWVIWGGKEEVIGQWSAVIGEEEGEEGEALNLKFEIRNEEEEGRVRGYLLLVMGKRRR